MITKLKAIYIDSNLRKKIIVLISLFVTLAPLTLVSVLAFSYYKLGISSAFNEQIERAISQTVEVADLYLKEHKENIRADILSIAKDIDREYYGLIDNPVLFSQFLDNQSEVRNLPEIIVFQKDRVIAKNSFSFSFAFERLPETELLDAESGEVIILTNQQTDKVRAVLKLTNFTHTYLLVGMYVDQSIIDHLKISKGSAEEYHDIMNDLKSAQFKLTVIFVILLFGVSTISILLGKKLAEIITDPLNNLVNATLKLREGDFSIQLPEKRGKDETSILTRAFNQMTSTLSAQREELLRSKEVIDERRRFIEKILIELSAGVITLDAKGEILLMNPSARALLGIDDGAYETSIKSVFPEVWDLIAQAMLNPSEIIQTNLKLTKGNAVRHLFLRVGTVLVNNDKIETVIITFDDITELVTVQRMAAWGDVARRVAHEIKNPLTPITLAAERLKSKFIGEITSDPKTFDRYVNTIITHSNDIRVIVEEFVDFARIPHPKLKSVDIVKVINDLVFSQSEVYRNIKFDFVSNMGEKIFVECDPMQITQVLLNVVKNAAESIEQRAAIEKSEYSGVINIAIDSKGKQNAEVKIHDNGMGIPQSMQDKIFEPYVTTKANGTGLGLSIVRKMLEDHNSSMSFKPSDEGAEFKFTLLLTRSEK